MRSVLRAARRRQFSKCVCDQYFLIEGRMLWFLGMGNRHPPKAELLSGDAQKRRALELFPQSSVVLRRQAFRSRSFAASIRPVTLAWHARLNAIIATLGCITCVP